MTVRDNDKGKPSGINGMTGGYDSHVLDVTRICAKSWELSLSATFETVEPNRQIQNFINDSVPESKMERLYLNWFEKDSKRQYF